MKVALVHDYLNQFGGAERVLSALTEIFPDAPVFTSIYDETKAPANIRRLEIRTSFMRYFPLVNQLFKWYVLFYPLAFESFDLSDYEVIVSSSSAFAKGVKKNPGQLHICYCHTPMRFVWRYEDYVRREEIPAWLKDVLPWLLEPVKRWDLDNSARVDYFIANSQTVAERIRRTYNRESVIINPPIDGTFFVPGPLDGDHFLIVSRLAAYKRIDIVIEAFNQLDLPLRVIGDGPDLRRLKNLAKPNISFLGRQSDEAVARQLAACRALIFPGEEDFGLAPLEALACGRPVLAYRAGGATETVIEERTGLFFNQQTSSDLVSAVRSFNFKLFDKQAIRQHALAYDKKVFKQKIADFVKEKYGEKFNYR